MSELISTSLLTNKDEMKVPKLWHTSTRAGQTNDLKDFSKTDLIVSMTKVVRLR